MDIDINNNLAVLPVLPLRDVVIFPNTVIPLFIGREKSINALEHAISDDKRILLITQIDGSVDNPDPSELYKVGVLATIVHPLIRLPDSAVKVLVQAVSRANVVKYIEADDMLHAEVKLENEGYEYENEVNIEALRRSIIKAFDNWNKLKKNSQPEVMSSVCQIKEVNRLADTIASYFSEVSDKQSILEIYDLKTRLEKILVLIEKESSILSVQNHLYKTVTHAANKLHRDYFLQEQLKAIEKELGRSDDGGVSSYSEFEKKINEVKLSGEAKEKVLSELKKYKKMNPISPEATVISNYLHWLLDLPWEKYHDTKINLNSAKKILDENHYGVEKVKDRIIEFLAVLKRVKRIKGPILCLVGPPGVGKTSLAQSIAKAIGRNFVRMSLGGIRDESEIRGHRKTYIGSMPGKIIQHIKKANSCNPLFLLDEIDKIGSDFRGDPASALLEVLDSEHNKHFVDHYIEVEFDLSNVMFITTANSLNIPYALLDRMEVIKLSGYNEDEKVKIAEQHLIKKLKRDHGLHKKEWSISESALYKLIRLYTRESGVRSFKRELDKLMRKAVKKILLDKNKTISIEADNLPDYLGVQKYIFGNSEDQDLVGVVTGLAYTETGGDILMIESVRIPGKGTIKYTGKLGEVMQESVKASYSYVRSNCLYFGIKHEEFQKCDIHLHVPEGAVPKDGPSAGIAMCTSIVSLMTGIPVNKTVAMTGEVTLRGRILAIGGLREKLLAALRSSIKTVIIPYKNKKDLQEIPENVKKGLNIIPVQNVNEVMKIALTKPIGLTYKIDERNSQPNDDNYTFKH
ncbi:endopeptidase La [Wolbachia endosymbiont of Pentidionis agamae]|uniref:endopeptidase La n=1 Tax=Wolbachia endosymbiont of Pentidionis agamae TaxID=3110435 RepID=UPI002FD40834